jgi:hypothetical protein
VNVTIRDVLSVREEFVAYTMIDVETKSFLRFIFYKSPKP